MRRIFKDELHKRMETDKDIFVLVGDLGFGMFNDIQKDFPDRFINCGASEQAMMGMAVGLAYKGKRVFVYSITNFLIYRPFETIRNYIMQENLPICLVAAGRDKDYESDGISHHSTDVKAVLGALESVTPLEVNLKTYFPDDKDQISDILDEILLICSPSFISLRRWKENLWV